MRRKRKIPVKPRFSEATMKGYQLLTALELKELPIDPFEIIDQFDNWYIQSWSELKAATGEADPLYLKRDGIEARTQIIRGSNDYMIVYDDSYTNGRLRWTIAHEIGHIILGHLIDFEETALNRGGLSKKQYGVLEVEAHWFAEAILAPNAILSLFDIRSAQEIAFLCDISKDASIKCEEHLANFQWGGQNVEFELLRNFYSFFQKDQHRQAIKEGIDKFFNSRLYPEFSKICRICRTCSGYITDKDQEICHICGTKLPEIETPYHHLPKPGVFFVHSHLQEGQYHPSFSVDENNRLQYCPVCRNHDFGENASHCKICGSTLVNKCLHDNTVLTGEHHYCPSCGNESVFEREGLYEYLKEVELPDLEVYENGKYEDYIEYEHWEYIINLIYALHNRTDAFSVLEGTKMIRDEDSFIIFTERPNNKEQIEAHEDLIKKYIEDYAFSEINKVEVLVL